MNAVVANDVPTGPARAGVLNAPFAWLLRREVWESKAIWMVPAIVAGLLLISTLVATLQVGDLHGLKFDADISTKLGGIDASGAVRLSMAFQAAVGSVFYIAMLFVQLFYAVDALYTDRRDRSMLFWKSLPVSDAQTVLSKFVTAAVVIPVFAWIGAFVAQILIGLVVSAKIAGTGLVDVGQLWLPTTWLPGVGVTLYATLADAIWAVPMVGYLLLVSALAPRSPFMWATLLPLALGLVEKIAFQTNYVLHTVAVRTLGALPAAFDGVEQHGMSVQLGADAMSIGAGARPLAFFTDVEVWAGLAVGALLIAAAIWARRYRDET